MLSVTYCDQFVIIQLMLSVYLGSKMIIKRVPLCLLSKVSAVYNFSKIIWLPLPHVILKKTLIGLLPLMAS
jgi:hypothetical protein